MLEKSLERGWRVLLRCGSEHGLEALDALLWTCRDDGLPAARHRRRRRTPRASPST